MKTVFEIQYNTRWGESLCLMAGDCRFPMSWGEGGRWSVTVPDCSPSITSDYWYAVLQDGFIVRTEWKHHSSRPAPKITDNWLDCPIEGCPFPREHSAAIFDRPGFRGAGTAVPVFSLRTEEDFGIGEFNDLKPLVDWAAATGQCIIQLLPINDTTRRGGWEDSYPYSPVSAFALNPMYIHLPDIGVRKNAGYKALQRELNALAELDYPRVYEAKTNLMREAFSLRGDKDMATPAFSNFRNGNSFWLEDYSVFCARRDGDDPHFHEWIQFHLDRQLSRVVEYAHSRGVYLKGDLPIGISADSADAMVHPELFNLDSTAGAPPDFFSADGQNWGFPTYDWEAMARDGYSWWKARLRKMARYFDAFRIDHILGFFRIWEIPAEYSSGRMGHFNPALPLSREEIERMSLPVEGLFLEDPRHPGYWQPMISPDTSELNGWQKSTFDALYVDFFFHRHDEFWGRNASRKLPELLSATGMLACGEDLGMVPHCVHPVMEEQKILSLEMAMMDKGREWPYLSVCATSSHDMETLRMQGGDADRTPGECRSILEGHLGSRSMLAIFPVQDWLSLNGTLRRKDWKAERINEPADPHHHWRYRLHLNLEEMSRDEEFISEIKGMIGKSGRAGY